METNWLKGGIGDWSDLKAQSNKGDVSNDELILRWPSVGALPVLT